MLQYSSVQGAVSEVLEQSIDGTTWTEADSIGTNTVEDVTYVDAENLSYGQHYYFRIAVSNGITTSYSNVFEYTVPESEN